MKNNYLVIMAGGIGSRFWPMSTKETPKQFLDILGTGETMIQQTVSRMGDIIPSDNIYVVTSVNYKQLVKEQLPYIPESNILLEPCMRNTAPCIAYACCKIYNKDIKANIVVAPSDHLVTETLEFKKIIKEGLEFTKDQDVLLTLGITPHRPETGYGYIQSGDKFNSTISQVAAFKEKPDLEIAKSYVASGNYFWNSGIFIWSAKSIMGAFDRYLPEISKLFKSGSELYNTDREQDFIDDKFPTCEKVSIDYGVMERADNIFVLPASFGWSDLGTWGSLWEKGSKDYQGNSVVGEKVHLFECNNTIVTVPNDRAVVLQGLDNFIVAEANGVLMICKKEEEQRIKEFSAVVDC